MVLQATYIFLNLFVAVVLDNFTFLYSLQVRGRGRGRGGW